MIEVRSTCWRQVTLTTNFILKNERLKNFNVMFWIACNPRLSQQTLSLFPLAIKGFLFGKSPQHCARRFSPSFPFGFRCSHIESKSNPPKIWCSCWWYWKSPSNSFYRIEIIIKTTVSILIFTINFIFGIFNHYFDEHFVTLT